MGNLELQNWPDYSVISLDLVVDALQNPSYRTTHPELNVPYTPYTLALRQVVASILDYESGLIPQDDSLFLKEFKAGMEFMINNLWAADWIYLENNGLPSNSNILPKELYKKLVPDLEKRQDITSSMASDSSGNFYLYQLTMTELREDDHRFEDYRNCFTDEKFDLFKATWKHVDSARYIGMCYALDRAEFLTKQYQSRFSNE